MNKIKSLFVAIGLLLSTSVSAYDFEVDGLQYDVVSLSDLTCKLVGSENGFEGDIVIPAHVNYSNKTLTVVEIRDELFKNCQLTGITIPNTILSIGDKVFEGCTNLERVKIEDGETRLKLGAGKVKQGSDNEYFGLFHDCPITSLYVGRNLSYLCGYGSTVHFSPFCEITTMLELTIGNSVTEIGIRAFEGCSGLTSVTIPNSVTRISVGAFDYCSSLTSITIPNSVIYIDFGAFSGCCSLTSVTIPNSVTEIGWFAFSNCSSLTSVIIGNSVEEIGEGAFENCEALTELYSLNPTPPIINSETFTNNQYMTLNVYVPEGSLQAYQEAEGWKNFWNLAEGAPTGINQITTDNDAPDIIYDLQGNKLNSPKRGINIINGKKVMMK